MVNARGFPPGTFQVLVGSHRGFNILLYILILRESFPGVYSNSTRPLKHNSDNNTVRNASYDSVYATWGRDHSPCREQSPLREQFPCGTHV